MSPLERESRLAESLEDFHLRRTRGEAPRPEDYEDGLAEDYHEFLQILDVEALLDDLLEPPPEPELPRSFGPFTLTRELGRGSSGVVYEAENPELGRREAVKVLRSDYHAEGTTFERFRREAKTLASVHHPNIVDIYGAGQVDGRPYYSMTLLEGRSIKDLVRDGEVPAPEVVSAELAGVADALHVLHEHGAVHRDVNPANIIQAADGRLVLADFGLARSLASPRVTRTGQMIGTPLYMSPEQFLGRAGEVDRRSDVYGLGATLYHALTGRPVFEPDDMRTLWRMVEAERPEPVRRVAPDVPADVAAIAMKAIEKRADDRYATAAEMRDDLHAFAAGHRVRGRPVSNLRRGLRRVRTFALPAAAALLLLLGAGWWYLGRPGTIRVRSTYEADVWLDGTRRGTTPLDLPLAPGRYLVDLRHPHLLPDPQVVELGAGQTYPVRWAIPRLRDSDDPAALLFLAGEAGLEEVVLEKPAVERAEQELVSIAVFPAGRVRRSDLTVFQVELGELGPPDGTRIVFRRGDALLHEEVLESESLHVEAALPRAVVAAIEPGVRVTWGLEGPDGFARLRTFEVVGDDPRLDATLTRVDEVVREQTPAVGATLRAKALLQADLPYAAWRAVHDVVDRQDPSRTGIGPWIVMEEALVAMGVERSAEWGPVQEVIWQAFPRPVAWAWYGRAAADE